MHSALARIARVAAALSLLVSSFASAQSLGKPEPIRISGPLSNPPVQLIVPPVMRKGGKGMLVTIKGNQTWQNTSEGATSAGEFELEWGVMNTSGVFLPEPSSGSTYQRLMNPGGGSYPISRTILIIASPNETASDRTVLVGFRIKYCAFSPGYNGNPNLKPICIFDGTVTFDPIQ